jgi:enamine deaminase RidA (YjgF/YER057c/UK114 family)
MPDNSFTPAEEKKSNRRLLLWFLLALLIALLPWLVLAQDNNLKKEKFFFDEKSENDIGYAQAVKVGNTIYVSGTVGSGTMDQSVESVYNDLLKTLQHYGADFSNVVKENVFTTDLDAFKKSSPIRNAYYAKDFPSASWIQVQRLYEPSFNLEVEIVAVLKE